MPKIRVNPAALKDLLEIKTYITQELSSPDAARRVIRRIVEAYKRLAEFPLMGAPLSSVVEQETDFRFLLCGNYIVFYKSDKTCVSIYRVLYGRRDYLSVLFGHQPEEEK